MSTRPIQDSYPVDLATCYGCGPSNQQGLHIQTIWDGEAGLCRFTPREHQNAFPGVVYGGLIASLIDCHGIGTATAAAYQAEGRRPGSEPALTFVTGSLLVKYLKPTPLGVELALRAWPHEIKKRKITVHCTLSAGGEECAQGEVVAVRAAWEAR